jgi:hypothetical protein
MENPASHPDIEEWYNNTARRFLKRPLPARSTPLMPSSIKAGLIDLQLFTESAKGRIDRLVAEGKISKSAVDNATEIWETTLKTGIIAPNKELIRIELSDLYHLIVDERILRHPERLKSMIRGIYEIRTADKGRRLALSSWEEGRKTLAGYTILEKEGRVRTAHIVDIKKISKLKKQGELIWQK